MRVNLIEVIAGALVLVVAAFFVIFAYTSTRWHTSGGYELWAAFDKADGLAAGSDVRISGVKVGTIVSLKLNKDNFLAQVKMSLHSHIRLPKDSMAEIVSEGFLGPRYLSLVPGGSEDFLVPGSQIMRTQAGISLESLIGKFLFKESPSKSIAP